MIRRRAISTRGFLSAVMIVAAAGDAGAAALCVNPGGTSGCFATIQQAVDAASAGSTISVAAGAYAENVELRFPKRVTIIGAGSTLTSITGDGLAPVIMLEAGTRLALSGARIEGGTTGIVVVNHARLSVSACAFTANGSGIAAGPRSRTDVDDSTITGNGPGGFVGQGSGIDSLGTLSIVRSVVSANVGTRMAIRSNRRLSVIDSTISDNEGTGIQLNRRAVIKGSTVSGHTDGGVHANFQGQVTISNSTLSGNSTPFSGGALGLPSGQATLDHVTIANNSAGAAGGGIFTVSTGKIRIRSSIIADNTAPIGNDCSSNALRAVGVNLVEDTGFCTIAGGSTISADPVLGPLQNDGGPTETHALLAGSPAIGVLTAGSTCQSPDQRGVPRAAPCDLGAYEAP